MCICDSGFPPVAHNFDIPVRLVLDELLGPLSDDLGVSRRSEGKRWQLLLRPHQGSSQISFMLYNVPLKTENRKTAML